MEGSGMTAGLRESRAYGTDEVLRLVAFKGRIETRAALARFDVGQRDLTEFGGEPA